MEYYLCRAMEVCRLSGEQLARLHVAENNIKRGLYPFEIQALFKLCTLKEHYGIPPDNEIAQANHDQKLRVQFRRLKLIPLGEDLVLTKIDALKKFDLSVIRQSEDLALDLTFHARNQNRRSIETFQD